MRHVLASWRRVVSALSLGLALNGASLGKGHALGAPSGAPVAQVPDAILGFWTAPDGSAVVEVKRRPAGYVGLVSKAPKAERVGTEVFRNVVWQSEQHRWVGEVFAPKRGKYYPATFAIDGDGALVVKVGSGFVSKTLTWRRGG